MEEWIRWEPIDELPWSLYLEKLIEDKNGTLLKLKDKNSSIEIDVIFEYSVFSITYADEGRRLRTTNYLDEKYGGDFYSKWVFFKVINSPYVKWVNEETYNIYESYNIEHYVFLTIDEYIDIVSTYAPIINVIK